MSLIYKCDRCGNTTIDEYSMYIVSVQDLRRNLDSKSRDICKDCWKELYKWLRMV